LFEAENPVYSFFHLLQLLKHNILQNQQNITDLHILVIGKKFFANDYVELCSSFVCKIFSIKHHIFSQRYVFCIEINLKGSFSMVLQFCLLSPSYQDTHSVWYLVFASYPCDIMTLILYGTWVVPSISVMSESSFHLCLSCANHPCHVRTLILYSTWVEPVISVMSGPSFSLELKSCQLSLSCEDTHSVWYLVCVS
jgi:hypothetical protein